MSLRLDHVHLLCGEGLSACSGLDRDGRGEGLAAVRGVAGVNDHGAAHGCGNIRQGAVVLCAGQGDGRGVAAFAVRRPDPVAFRRGVVVVAGGGVLNISGVRRRVGVGRGIVFHGCGVGREAVGRAGLAGGCARNAHGRGDRLCAAAAGEGCRAGVAVAAGRPVAPDRRASEAVGGHAVDGVAVRALHPVVVVVKHRNGEMVIAGGRNGGGVGRAAALNGAGEGLDARCCAAGLLRHNAFFAPCVGNVGAVGAAAVGAKELVCAALAVAVALNGAGEVVVGGIVAGGRVCPGADAGVKDVAAVLAGQIVFRIVAAVRRGDPVFHGVVVHGVAVTVRSVGIGVDLVAVFAFLAVDTVR